MRTTSAPSPTRINKVCVTGPVYHYENITDEQLAALGITMRPGSSTRSSVSAGGVTVRRLKSGHFNASVVVASGAGMDLGFSRFLGNTLKSASPDMEAGLKLERDEEEEESGIWCLRLADRMLDLSPGIGTIFGRPTMATSISLDEALQLVPQVHRCAIERAIDKAVAGFSYNTSYTRRADSGELIALGSNATVIRNASRALCLVGVLRRLPIVDRLTQAEGVSA